MDFGILNPADAQYIVGKDTQVFVMRSDDFIRDEITFHLRWAENGPDIDSEVSTTIETVELYKKDMTPQSGKLYIMNKLKEKVDDARNKSGS